jgi:predicted PurR-regulated permease PerM
LHLRREDVTSLVLQRIEGITAAVGGATTGLWRGAQGLLSVVSFLVVTPVVTFYLLRDFDRLREQMIASIPDERRAGFERFLAQLDRSISGYIRGQLLVGSALGLLFFLGLTALGIQYALVVGVSSVLFNFVPYVGSVLTAILALAVGLLTDPSWNSVVKVGALYGVLQLLDSAVISPRIMGHSLRLHPVFVMIAVLLGGQFFGLIGILLAVPAAALLKESLGVWTPEVLGLLPGLRDDTGTASAED